MGHTLGSGEHGAYGNAPSLRLRAKWIAKINPLNDYTTVSVGEAN
jgi:hypothetical protein